MNWGFLLLIFYTYGKKMTVIILKFVFNQYSMYLVEIFDDKINVYIMCITKKLQSSREGMYNIHITFSLLFKAEINSKIATSILPFFISTGSFTHLIICTYFNDTTEVLYVSY